MKECMIFISWMGVNQIKMNKHEKGNTHLIHPSTWPQHSSICCGPWTSVRLCMEVDRCTNFYSTSVQTCTQSKCTYTILQYSLRFLFKHYVHVLSLHAHAKNEFSHLDANTIFLAFVISLIVNGYNPHPP